MLLVPRKALNYIFLLVLEKFKFDLKCQNPIKTPECQVFLTNSSLFYDKPTQ